MRLYNDKVTQAIAALAASVAASRREDFAVIVPPPLACEPVIGCRNAGCRTFADCLCTCKRCRVECAHRKVQR